MIKGTLKKVVFLDRDGVINRDSRHYVKSWEEFQFLPGSLSAIRRLSTHGHPVIIITNQSAVHRRIIPISVLDDIHTKLKQSVQFHGGEIKDIFFCPHRPDENCACRKPKPGLIIQAMEKYRIDRTTATMVGDSPKDIESAQNAGCRYRVLVKSGIRNDAERVLTARKIYPDHIAENLFQATDWIIDRFGTTENTG